MMGKSVIYGSLFIILIFYLNCLITKFRRFSQIRFPARAVMLYFMGANYHTLICNECILSYNFVVDILGQRYELK